MEASIEYSWTATSSPSGCQQLSRNMASIAMESPSSRTSMRRARRMATGGCGSRSCHPRGSSGSARGGTPATLCRISGCDDPSSPSAFDPGRKPAQMPTIVRRGGGRRARSGRRRHHVLPVPPARPGESGDQRRAGDVIEQQAQRGSGLVLRRRHLAQHGAQSGATPGAHQPPDAWPVGSHLDVLQGAIRADPEVEFVLSEDPRRAPPRREQVPGSPIEPELGPEPARPGHEHGAGAPDRPRPPGRRSGGGVAGWIGEGDVGVDGLHGRAALPWGLDNQRVSVRLHESEVFNVLGRSA